MDFIYNVPDELKHYDTVLNSWNEMTRQNIDNPVQSIITNVAKWWEEYPTKDSKVVDIYTSDSPSSVWKIFSKYKITNYEKILGIFYTLEYILGDDMCLELSSIQFTDDGKVDIAVIIENFLVCRCGLFDSGKVRYTVLQNHSTILRSA